MKGPTTPSREAVEENWLSGHVNYRDSCEVYIQARGKEDAHRRDDGKERTLPEYCYDYCFPGDEMGCK